METVAGRPEGAEINLLTIWGDPSESRRSRKSGALSILVHIAAICGLALIPKGVMEPRQFFGRITPLIAPPEHLTQTAPNKGKLNKEFSASASMPRPEIRLPAGLPEFRPAPVPPAPTIPEPPKLQAAARTDAPALPQPQIQPIERPSTPFENPTATPTIEPGKGLPLPRATAADAIRGAVRSGGINEAISIPAAPGVQPNSMELLSDPMGVDFRPYISQILFAVKRYWMAVWPESARMGRSGKVAIQFSIDRGGGVPKLVIASSSGVSALDRAAVAAISGSVPFPQLPREFAGDLIKLQLNFAYNMPQ